MLIDIGSRIMPIGKWMPARCVPVTVLLALLAARVPTARSQDAAPQDPVFPRALVEFKPDRNNPVFRGAGPGHWDALIRERGWILREGDKYRMWYTGYRDRRGGKMALGLATSTDGIHWKRHSEKPIYDQHWVEDMIVVPHDGMYYMFAEGRHDRAQLLRSKDGVTWQRVGTLDIRLADGRPIPPGPFGTPTAWYDAKQKTWYLMYERRDEGIWLATSRDMKVWTNVQDDPVMRPGPAEHEREMIALNQVIRYGGRYYAYYHGRGAAPYWSTNIATSTDLLHWTKYEGNPLQPARQNKSSGIVVHDGKRFRLYTMHPAVHLHWGPESPAP